MLKWTGGDLNPIQRGDVSSIPFFSMSLSWGLHSYCFKFIYSLFSLCLKASSEINGLVAVTAAARRLLLCCYSVLKNKMPFYDQA
jgi:hypothetical protein